MDPKLAEIFERNRLERERRKQTRAPAQETPVAEQTAVAPAPLYPWLDLDQEVIHEPTRAEDYLARCQTTFDLIVNDMMVDPQDSARLMVEYAAHLRPEGIAIMTLKLREHNRSKRMDHSFRLLRKAYKIIQVRQLVSNKQEVTLFLRRQAS